MTEADDHDGQTGGRQMFVIEDLGAPPIEDDLAGVPDDLSRRKHRLELPHERIKHVLARTEERDMAGKVGRPRDMHKEMQRVAAIFGTVLDAVTNSFAMQPHENQALGPTIHQDLLHQQQVAEMWHCVVCIGKYIGKCRDAYFSQGILTIMAKPYVFLHGSGRSCC